MKHKICVDSIGYLHKPDKKEAGFISSRIASQIKEVDLGELSQYIDNGHTWCPGTYKNATRKARHWQQQSLFCADIDKHNLSLAKVLDLARSTSLEPCLIHHSFSSEPENKKYRVVFAFKQALTEGPMALAILRCIKQEMNCDPCIVDLARLFYSGKPGCIVYFNDYLNAYDDAIFEKFLAKLPKGNALSPLEEVDLKKANSRKATRAIMNAGTKILDSRVPRYMRTWHAARMLAQSGCFTTTQILSRIVQFQSKSGDFVDWDKNTQEIVQNAVNWSVKNVDE